MGHERGDAGAVREGRRGLSLLGRLWLSVAAALLAGLLASVVLGGVSARDYLVQQLHAQAVDSAGALALALSRSGQDAVLREQLVSNLFDGGHFASIQYRDHAGRVLVARLQPDAVSPVPTWFVALLPLPVASGEAWVAEGWQQSGRVEVRVSAREAYAALWSGLLRQLGVQLGVGAALCLAVLGLLRWAQKPLRAIGEQAAAVGANRFVLLPEPSVAELRVVGRAMNTMVVRVQAMFAEQAARLEALRNEANCDDLTRLPNRSLFMGWLRGALADEQAAPEGALVVVRVRDLARLNRSLGRERTDILLQASAAMLRELVQQQDDPGASLARLNGAEFGILLPAVDATACVAWCGLVLDGFARLYRQEYADREPVASVGWTLYRHGEAPAGVMLRVDDGLMQAESRLPPLAGNPGATPLLAARGEAWRQRLETALATRAFRLAFFPVLRVNGSLLHHEAMLRMLDGDGQPVTAGQFMPAASRLGLTARLDLLALELAMTHLEVAQEDVAVNLSPLSLLEPTFLPGVRAILGSAGRRAQRLWVELSERGIGERNDLDALAEFAALLRAHGCRFGIEHFGRHFAAMPRLHVLQVDYLKLDGAFVAEIENNVGNQRFVKTVVDVAHGLDIEVIAERVASPSEWQALTALGVAGVTGPGVALS